ncbi:hypothetical protein ACFL3Q_08315 [Planctomycetota bacterium]
MKAAKIVVVCIVIFALVKFVTKDIYLSLSAIPKLLPFCSGKPVNFLYEVSAIALLLLAIWGICRLAGGTEESEKSDEPDLEQEDYFYETQEDDAQQEF